MDLSPDYKIMDLKRKIQVELARPGVPREDSVSSRHNGKKKAQACLKED